MAALLLLDLFWYTKGVIVVNLEYVKKRRRKKIAAAVSGISAIVVVTFVLLSFLGQNLGSFTINLKGTGVSLSLSEKSSMENQTSYLQIGSVPPMDTFTYGMLDGSADIDNEETDYLMGAQYNVKGEVVDLNYLKYTFFLSNVGPTVAMFDFSLKFLDNQDGGNVDNTDVKDILRIGLYSNTEKMNIMLLIMLEKERILILLMARKLSMNM